MGSILGQINRLVKANVQWLLNKSDRPIEDCESHIEQIEQAIEEGRTCAASYAATCHRMQHQQDQLRQSQAKLHANARAALSTGDEENARRLLGEKVVLDERIASLQPGIDRGREAYEQLRNSLAGLRDQLIQARAELAELQARKAAAEAHIAFDEQLGTARHAEQTHVDQLTDEVLHLEADVEVRQDMQDPDAELERQLRQQGREMQIEAELETLRGQMESDNEETPNA